MPKKFEGLVEWQSGFNVKSTEPLDDRLVVQSKEDLTNGTIDAPYQGMVVNIAGTSELWVLTTQGDDNARIASNWQLVTGNGSGNGLSKYSIPIMTPEMLDAATEDSDVDFDGSESPYILTDFDMNSLEGETVNNTVTSINGTYLDIMMKAIRSLQAEVARLKNSFDYGIDSYKNERTAKSVQKSYYEDVVSREPLWAIDPGYLSEVPDNFNFNTYLGKDHSFSTIGTPNIDVSVDGQLTFVDCKGVFYDGKIDDGGVATDLTLYELKDSKLITYLVTDKPTVKMMLVSLDSSSRTREVDFSSLLNGNTVNKYGFCVVISRKVKDSKTNTEKGFNYVYFSIINYETDEKLCEGYLTDGGYLVDTRVDLDERYSIKYLEFDRLTLSRMKFYTKFEDFSEEVISSAPSEDDWKYEVAHITIRSVENSEILERVKDQLRDNELIWNKKNGTLHIKSDGKIHLIGSNTKPNEENNNEDNMTNEEIVAKLAEMGIVVNVEYNADGEIESINNMSLAPISDFTFVNGDTGKKFTFTVDNEGNLVGKDKSAKTLAEELGSSVSSFDIPSGQDYKAVRGFSSDYFLRKDGKASDLNKDGDVKKNSDRLRFSSFYAPIATDTSHGCTHSFVELENTSDKDIPLTGMYLHFYNPYEDKVYHLALEGVVKSGSTYLIRGAKHAEFDDESAFIKVRTFDQEWYDNGKLVSFEQVPVKSDTTRNDEGDVVEIIASDSPVKFAYRFCLTFGLPDLGKNEQLVEIVTAGNTTINGNTYSFDNYPNIIHNPRFVDSCSFSTFAVAAKQKGTNNPWYINGLSGSGIVIKPNSMFRLTFALDPAKQAYNGFNAKDGSRIRYNKDQDLQILKLDKAFIGFDHSDEVINIDRYTPKASFEHRNVMTDKTQLDREKPNMVTCSFGNDVYNTRCFNWISCGVFDEYVWIRKQGTPSWTKFQSYTKGGNNTEDTELPRRKEYSDIVNDTVYARMINRFPGNDVLFTAHKCVLVLEDAESAPVVYEYVVGRPDKDGNPDTNHTNEIYTFTISPRSYEGRLYQITDQQGFHWIEYQVWASAATFLNEKITSECEEINNEERKDNVFPILFNTGDMTQSGSRINEWLDYYNAGKKLFNHLEQMNCVGNNDLCDTDPRNLGTGDDTNKSNAHFFHYFYCFDVKDDDRYTAAADDQKKFFNGESLIVKAHTCTVTNKKIDDRYIPSFYYFKTKDVMYITVNSEIPINGVQGWYGLSSMTDTTKYVNIYTGIETNIQNGSYGVKDADNNSYFTPLYETMYAWLNDNNENAHKKVVVAMHEMPFTVITKASLNSKKTSSLPCTRNHPTGPTSARVGSNVNQLEINENRGTYWFTRLLEFFGCKIVIGGHKHTYALSYPIKEKYTWTYTGNTVIEDIEQNHVYDSMEKTKPMSSTLEDEAGQSPMYNISWDIVPDEEYYTSTPETQVTNRQAYKLGIDSNDTTTRLNSTKTPYIPENLYNDCGLNTYNTPTDIFRCCTPIPVNDDEEYNGFVTYSMCQATGYKLKSNKELPSEFQVFSKIIPETKHEENKDTHKEDDKPSGDQLYPMYSVLEFANNCTSLDILMIRITNIFEKNGKDAFVQGSKNNIKNMGCQYLCSGNTDANKKMYGTWKSSKPANNEKYVHIKF